MSPTQANRSIATPLTVDEGKAVLRIIRRVIDASSAKDTAGRNKVYDLTNELLRVCHSRTCTLDLVAMADRETDLALVLEDLGTLRRNLNRKTGHMDYGTRLNFATNMAFKKKPAQVAA
ncbi:hypothetical protein AD951_04340 [Acetobacter malorum]|uniref:Uncharacterized protein n=1 Tax=Acetobacter malorum TaxID=178901 RepID=A0A149UQC6_9PROT|nr:hypothetical protein [Acetobacter malorum]KXV69956.1 hypothetical protein AD951_04340 [Acetobacter malorum]